MNNKLYSSKTPHKSKEIKNKLFDYNPIKRSPDISFQVGENKKKTECKNYLFTRYNFFQKSKPKLSSSNNKGNNQNASVNFNQCCVISQKKISNKNYKWKHYSKPKIFQNFLKQNNLSKNKKTYSSQRGSSTIYSDFNLALEKKILKINLPIISFLPKNEIKYNDTLFLRRKNEYYNQKNKSFFKLSGKEHSSSNHESRPIKELRTRY